ncbi:MAG: AsmA family protein [Xanthobacteraceae bacterium]
MKALKVAAITLGTIVAVAIVLAFVGIPVGLLLGAVKTDVEAATGYELKVAGSATLRLLPSPSVIAHDVSLLDTRSGGPETGVRVESVRIAASLQSLFGDRPVVTEAVLTKPVFRAPLLRQRTAPILSRQASSARSSPPRMVTVEHFAVHEGTVEFVNARGQIESKLGGIELLGSLSADDQFNVIVSARAGEQNLSLKVKGEAPRGGFDGRPLPLSFAFEAPGLLQAPLNGTAEVRVAGSQIKVNSVSGAIGQSKFSGFASIDADNKPFVKVDLDFQSVDLGAVRPVGAGSAQGSAPGSIDQPWSSAPIDLNGLNFFDAEVQISAAALNVETFHFAPISVTATINNGVVRAAFPSVGLYGGQASGGIAADVSGADQLFAVRFDVTGVRALPMLTDVAGFTSLDGSMQAKIDLHAQGGNERAILSSLDGTLDLSFQNGEIRSVNIAQMIRNVAASILSGWQAGQTEKTDFAQLSALFRLSKGQATTDNLALVGPLVRVTGAGTADIGAKTLAFRLDPKLVMSLEGQGSTANPVGLGVPVMVQGTWGAPKIYPEVAGMLDNPDAAFAKLRELGQGLFGNSAAGGQPGSGNILQGIGDMLKNLGNKPGSQTPQSQSAPAPKQ